MKNKVMLGFTSLAAIALSLNSVVPVLADTGTTNPATPAQTAPSNDQNKSTNQADPTKSPTDNKDTTNTKPATDQKNPGADTSAPSSGNANTGSQTVNVADLNKAISLNKKFAKLTKTSYVYDKNGKRVKNEKLKKGTIIGVSGVTTVKGQVLIGFNGNKNKYISVKNVKAFKVIQYTVKQNAYVYNPNGQRINRYYLKKGKKIVALKTKKIHGVKYVVINKNYLIRWSSLDHKSAKELSAAK